MAVLRTIRGWRQEDLARAAGSGKARICRVEHGAEEFSMGSLERLIAALEVPFSVFSEAVSLVRRVRAGGKQGQAAPSGAIQAVLTGGPLPSPAAGLLRAAAPLVLAELCGPPRPGGPAAPAPSEARQLARGLWARLRPYGFGERRALVREGGEFQGWALCELVCEESVTAAADDARAAVGLGLLAVRIAQRVGGEERWRRRLEGYARAFLANAVRVAGRLAAADKILMQALEVWESGELADPAPLDAARLLDLEASLRRDQRRLPESLDLLDRALTLHPAGHAAARLLVSRAKTLEEANDYERAVDTLRRAGPQIDPAREPRLLLVLRWNLAWDLCHLGRAAEAEPLMPEVRALAGRLGNRLDLVRLRWLEGLVAAGRGRTAEAATAFAEVRDGFLGLHIPYDAGLATLQLAVLYAAEGGRSAEVKALAASAAPIFEAEEVHAEARKALALFRRAAAEERLTVGLARALLIYLDRARHDPALRFEASREGSLRE